jgi:hypothetical protein
MKVDARVYRILKWTSRISATAVLMFGLPFYFGYGNPLPFTNPQYSLYDNTWLSAFPLMFIGLALGWKWPKPGGFLITVPILFGFVVSMVTEGDIPIHMAIPLIVGLMYFLTASSTPKN